MQPLSLFPPGPASEARAGALRAVYTPGMECSSTISIDD